MDDAVSKGGRLQFLVIAVLLLLLPFGWYYFVYVSSEKAYLTDRNFRLLGLTSQEIQARIESLNQSWDQMNGDLSSSFKKRQHPLEDCDKFKKNEEEHAKEQINLIWGLDRNSTKVECKNLEETKTENGDGHSPLSFKVERKRDTVTALSFKVERKRDTVTARFRSQYPDCSEFKDKESEDCKGAKYTVQITAESNLSSLLTPIVSRPEFDDVLVVKPKDGQQDGGEVVFQRESGGIQVLTLSLPVEKNQQGGENKESQSNRLVEIELGGTHYQAFLQPLQLSFSTGQKTEKREWLVCGLVRSNRFLSESLSIPTPVLLGFLFLILTAALTWPFLNLWFLGLRERLSVSDVLFLAFSILIGSAFFTLLLLDAYAYRGFAAQMDQQLKDFADNIHENFHKELDNVDQQLRAISTGALQRSSQPDLSYQATNILSIDDLQYDISSPLEIRGIMDEVTFWIPKKSYADSTYPYFDSVFWVDSGGEQRSKWAVQTQTTPLINVYDREYFRSILQCWLWARQRDGKTVHFYVDPLYSWNTGENLTVYSIPMKEPSDSSLTCPSASGDGSVKPAVAALATRPLSLTQPVIPPGFGYAVITDDGSVLFHSDHRRNLQENFFAESHNNNRLRSAVFGHSAEWIDAQYGGKPRRLYVRPIDGLPWFLVVYRDKELLNTANLELLSVAMILLLSYLLILVVLLLLYLWMSGDRLRWLWPTPTQTSAYWLLGVINLVLSLAFYVGVDLVTDRPRSLAVVMVLVPVLEIVFVYRVLGRGLAFPFGFPGISEVSRKRDSFLFRKGYVLAVASIFLPLSVLPALAFFKIAYEEEMVLVVKHGQLQLATAVEQRERRVKDQYFSVQVDNKEQFLEKRLKLENALDIYMSFFFDTHVCGGSSAPCKEASYEDDQWFAGVLSKIKPFYSEALIALRGVLGPGSADNLWTWERTRPRREQLQFRKNQVEDNNSLQLVSTIPMLEEPAGVWGWIGLWLVPAFLLAILYWPMRLIARRVFLRDFLDPPNSGQQALRAKDISRNLLVLGPPFSGKSALLQRADCYVIDFPKRGEYWSETINYKEVAQETHKVIALDHFEYQLGVPEQDHAKLRLLEELLSTYQKPVIIASTIDPVAFYCGYHAGREEEAGKEPAGSHDRDSWAGIFSSFWEVYIGDEGDPQAFADTLSDAERHMSESAGSSTAKRLRELWRLVENECRPTAYLQEVGRKIVTEPIFAHCTPRELSEVIWDQARVYYQVVWSTCSTGEQFLLIRLAQDRFVNARNPDIDRLLRKRLIVRDPGLRLMNASFERFVRSVTPPPQVLAWEEKARTSGWNTLKGPLLVVLIGVGFFLYTTQPDLFNTTAAFASAVAVGGMPALFKLFVTFAQGDKAKQ